MFENSPKMLTKDQTTDNFLCNIWNIYMHSGALDGVAGENVS